MSQPVELPGPSQMKMRPVTSENRVYLKTVLKKFRKDEVNKQLNKLEHLVSCPKVLHFLLGVGTTTRRLGLNRLKEQQI